MPYIKIGSIITVILSMLSNSHTAYHKHDHNRCMDDAIQRAKSLCQDNNVRFTPIRQAVFKAIWSSHQPLGAYDIVEQAGQYLTTNKRILPTTVYRAIDFLLAQCLIHRIASLNAYIGCPFPNSNHYDFFLICHSCGAAAECSEDAVKLQIDQAAERSGFLVESSVIELVGLCPECRPHNTKQ